MPRSRPSRSRLAALFLCLLPLTACAFRDHRSAVESAYASGRFDLAAQSLDDKNSRALYGDRNDILWKLDRGSIALALGDDPACIRHLEEAERDIELAGQAEASDELARWAVNDTAARYIPQPYEDTYVNVLKLLAQLRSGNISGGATVEARRLASKSTMLRDRYLSYKERSGIGPPGIPRADLVPANEEGNFIESPLGTFLACITFMADDDHAMQSVAARRLLDAIRLQSSLIGDVRAEHFEGLADRSLGDRPLLLIALSGRGPTKRARHFGPIVIGRVPVYFELPTLIRNASSIAAVEAEFDAQPADPPPPIRLPLVEDMNAVAMENFRRALPLIYTRTLVRAATKAGASYAITQVARNSAGRRDRDLVTVAAVVGGLAAILATERADTRAWVTLPGQAHASLVQAPEHARRARFIYRDPRGGIVHTSPWFDLDPSAGRLQTLIGHYWN